MITYENEKYLPIEDVAILNEIDVNSLRSLYTKNNVYGNKDRFKMIDGKLYVLENYKYPLAENLDVLRRKALIIAKTENNLCKEISSLSGINKSTLNKYFYRFTFKQMKTAENVIKYLKQYINNNSLIPLEELTYEY